MYTVTMITTEEADKLSIEELWKSFSIIQNTLKEKNAIRSNNIVGERGESFALDYYSKNPNLPKLQLAPVGTKNIDAISIDGDRYSIKTVSYPNKTTGVFHGYGNPDNPINNKQFEYLLIVTLKDYIPISIIELTWHQFNKNKKWHKTMQAYNMHLSNNLMNASRVTYKQ